MELPYNCEFAPLRQLKFDLAVRRVVNFMKKVSHQLGVVLGRIALARTYGRELQLHPLDIRG